MRNELLQTAVHTVQGSELCLQMSSSNVVPVILWGNSPPTHTVSCIITTYEQKTVITGSTDGQLVVWDLRFGEDGEIKVSDTKLRVLMGHLFVLSYKIQHASKHFSNHFCSVCLEEYFALGLSYRARFARSLCTVKDLGQNNLPPIPSKRGNFKRFSLYSMYCMAHRKTPLFIEEISFSLIV